MTAPSTEDEAALDATRAPLMEHLIELRKRLVWAMLVVRRLLCGLLRLFDADPRISWNGRSPPPPIT